MSSSICTGPGPGNWDPIWVAVPETPTVAGVGAGVMPLARRLSGLKSLAGSNVPRFLPPMAAMAPMGTVRDRCCRDETDRGMRLLRSEVCWKGEPEGVGSLELFGRAHLYLPRAP